jgi:hypothetical protein
MTNSENTELIFILTNLSYLYRNYFIIHSANNKSSLKTIVYKYNKNKKDDDQFFCIYAVNVKNHKITKKIIKIALINFLISKKKRMYLIDYDWLLYIVNEISINVDKDIDYYTKIL